MKSPGNKQMIETMKVIMIWDKLTGLCDCKELRISGYATPLYSHGLLILLSVLQEKQRVWWNPSVGEDGQMLLLKCIGLSVIPTCQRHYAVSRQLRFWRFWGFSLFFLTCPQTIRHAILIWRFHIELHDLLAGQTENWNRPPSNHWSFKQRHLYLHSWLLSCLSHWHCHALDPHFHSCWTGH